MLIAFVLGNSGRAWMIHPCHDCAESLYLLLAAPDNVLVPQIVRGEPRRDGGRRSSIIMTGFLIISGR